MLAWSATRPTTYHFLDLNLEDAADLDDGWAQKTAAAAERIGAAWLCGDAGLWHFGPRDRAHSLLLPPVLTRDSAYAVADNVWRLSEATGFAVLPENPPAAFYLGDLHLLDYFALVAERAGCGIVLDCAHLAIYQRLRGLLPTTGLDGFPLDCVLEMHIAGGTLVDVDGLTLVDDAHGPGAAARDVGHLGRRAHAGPESARRRVRVREEPRRRRGRHLRPTPPRGAPPPAPVGRGEGVLRVAQPLAPPSVPRPDETLAAQSLAVRMLLDPTLHAAAAAQPDEVLRAAGPVLARQLAALDPRQLRLDRQRAVRLVGQLCDEWKASSTLLVAATRSGRLLTDFVCSAAFHQAVAEGDLVWAAFGRYLAALPLPAGAAPLLPDLLVIASAIGRARRSAGDEEAGARARADDARLRWARGVTAFAVDEAALAQLSAIEAWLFERALLPQAQLAIDLPTPPLYPRSGRARTLAVEPMTPTPSVVEIDEPLRQLLVAVGPEPRPLLRVIDDASARGWQRDQARTQLAELVEQQIVHAS